MEISKFWLDAPKYSLLEAAYLVCGLEPQNPNETIPAKVISACRQMKSHLVAEGRAYSDTHSTKIPVTIDFVREWADYFRETDFFNPEPPQIDKPLTESERDKLLKQIGVMALLLAANNKKYKLGDKPNASSIDKDVQVIFDAGKDQVKGKFEFPGQEGTGSTELRKSISAGLNLLVKKDDD